MKKIYTLITILTLTSLSANAADTEKKANIAANSKTAKTYQANEAFKRCAACHGEKGEKKAFGKSKVIADLSEQNIADALHGYKKGTYGKELKGIMKDQLSNMNEDEINQMAKYIANLKK